MKEYIKLHNKETLSIILNEAKVRSDALYKAGTKITEKSYVLFLIITSLCTYSLNELSKGLEYPFIYLLIGSLASAIVLIKNLLTKNVVFDGEDPDNLNHKYFKLYKKEELELVYLAYLIEGYQKNIDDNRKSLRKSVLLFKRTLYILIPVLVLFTLFSLYLKI